MAGPVRLQAIELPVPDIARVEKFYRWVLAMKPLAGEASRSRRSLGWTGRTGSCSSTPAPGPRKR